MQDTELLDRWLMKTDPYLIWLERHRIAMNALREAADAAMERR